MALTLCGCHNPVLDYEGDCEDTYRLRFVYDMNLKWADAFPSEVHSVNLYAFDANGVFIKEFMANGPQLDEPGYTMALDLPAGNYQLVAWCGLNNEGNENNYFTVTKMQPGVSNIEDLYCSLDTESSEDYDVCSPNRLNFLYHGYLEVDLPDSQDGSSYLYTMKLTKDTNHIRIILQQLSTVDMDPNNFIFTITDSNGEMNYTNALVGTLPITYLPWDKDGMIAGVGDSSSGNIVMTQGVYADLSVGRMMATHDKEFFLTVTDIDKNKDIIANVPVIQYALLSKEYYEMAYNRLMSDQEFLDREDEYVLTFFINENIGWADASILINSWRIVLSDYEVD